MSGNSLGVGPQYNYKVPCTKNNKICDFFDFFGLNC